MIIEFKDLPNNDMTYMGITTDMVKSIICNDVPVGIVYLSEMNEVDTIYIEYIEFFSAIRGKHLLRLVMEALSMEFGTLVFESQEELCAKYKAVGAEMGEYDRDREMYSWKYRLNGLESSRLAKQILGILKTNTFKASECDAIFDELKKQATVLGGKLFTDDDIRTELRKRDIEDSQYNVGIVNDHIGLKSEIYNDYTDEEWDVIDNAIDEATKNEEFHRYATDIDWDIDKRDFDNEAEYFAVAENLPTFVEIPDHIKSEYAADYVSDCYDYCVKNLRVSFEKPSDKEASA